jgi:hypothetical protein
MCLPNVQLASAVHSKESQRGLVQAPKFTIVSFTIIDPEMPRAAAFYLQL